MENVALTYWCQLFHCDEVRGVIELRLKEFNTEWLKDFYKNNMLMENN